MTNFETSLQHLHNFFSENSIEYAIIGGVAVIIYGEQRTTDDIYVTVLCELEHLDNFHKMMGKKFTPAFEGTLEYFKRNFILPLDDPVTELRIDIAAGLTEFDKKVISRRKKKFFGEVEVYVCSLEDLIIYKLFANREQDIADVKHLLEKQLNSTDKKYLLETAEMFRELEREDVLENLTKLFNQ